MDLETLLEAAKYVEYRSEAKARGEEPHDYDTFARLCCSVGGELKPESYAHEPPHLLDDGRLEKRRAGGAGTREVHNKLEKNRRAHLRECFDLLKKQLPSMDDRKTSNLSILRGALRYIHGLKRKEREYEHEMERLAREKIASQQRLAALKKELAFSSPHLDIAHFLTDNETTTTASECGASEVLSESSAPSCRSLEVVAAEAPPHPETPIINRSTPAVSAPNSKDSSHLPTESILSIPNGGTTVSEMVARPVVFPASCGVSTQIRLSSAPMVSAPSSLQIGSVFTASHTVQVIGQNNAVKVISGNSLPSPLHIITPATPLVTCTEPSPSLVRVATSCKPGALVSPVALVAAPVTRALVLNPVAAKQAPCLTAPTTTNGLVYTRAKTVLPQTATVPQVATVSRQLLAALKPGSVVSGNHLVAATHNNLLSPSSNQPVGKVLLAHRAKPVVMVGQVPQ